MKTGFRILILIMAFFHVRMKKHLIYLLLNEMQNTLAN